MSKQITLRWSADSGNYNLLSSAASSSLARQQTGKHTHTHTHKEKKQKQTTAATTTKNTWQTYQWHVQVILDWPCLSYLKLCWDCPTLRSSVWFRFRQRKKWLHHCKTALSRCAIFSWHHRVCRDATTEFYAAKWKTPWLKSGLFVVILQP